MNPGVYCLEIDGVPETAGTEKMRRGKNMKISARNQFKGKVKNIERGAVNSIVEIEVAPGVCFAASITNTSVDNLGLAEGSDAYAIVKASSVMVGVDA